MTNKAFSIVKHVYPDGTLLMHDNWICSMFKYVIVKGEEFMITKIEHENDRRFDPDFKRFIDTPLSVVTLNRNYPFEEGDILYTHI